MQGKLAQNVRAKFFQDFERAVSDVRDEPRGGRSNEAVDAILCGFILEGDDFNQAPEQTASVEQDWFYKL